MIFLVSLGFFGVSVHSFWKYPFSMESERHLFCDEFYYKLKDTKRARIYTSLFLAKRLIFVSWLAFFQFLPVFVKVLVMLIVQIAYSIVALIIRPFSHVRNNIVEIINEFSFTVLLAGLLRYNTEDDWSNIPEKVYLAIFVSNIA